MLYKFVLFFIVFIPLRLLALDQIEQKKSDFAQKIDRLDIEELQNLKHSKEKTSKDFTSSKESKITLNLSKENNKEVDGSRTLKTDLNQFLEEKNKDLIEEGRETKKISEGFYSRNRTEFSSKGILRDIQEEKEKKNTKQRWIRLLAWKQIKKPYQRNLNSSFLLHRKKYKNESDNNNQEAYIVKAINDYYMQLFYCIKKNNLYCLRGIINKLESLGLKVQDTLRIKNKLGDNLLIYAIKQNKIDVVRFLLLQGVDLKETNNSFKSPIEVAIELENINIINLIVEMTQHH